MISFFQRYWRWVLVLGLVDWLAWMAFELRHSKELGVSDLWPLRMSLWSGLLLFDNLCVLWWYAHTTQQQATAAQQQAVAAEAQINVRLREWRIQNKPVVFLDREMAPSRASADRYDTTYIVRNVGPGIAINVHVLTAHVDGRWDVETIGALEPGGSRVLPQLRHLEASAGELAGRIVVAEAMRMRTAQWVVTLNAADKNGQIRHGYLSERVASGVLTLATLLERHGQDFRSKLERLGQGFEDTEL
jgi:hypothetical protein